MIRYNHSLFVSLSNNREFFFEISKDIELILLDKNFKTSFKINNLSLDKFLYFNIIVKSMHFIDLETIKNELFLIDGMIHRTVVINNLNFYTKSINTLYNVKDITKNSIKLIMTLSKSLTWIKILIKEKGGLKTNFYLKFNIISNYDYNNRITINYCTTPYKFTDQYLIGASYLSICNFVKKSNWQLAKNKINADAIIKLSQQPICIDFSSWISYKTIIIDEISKKYKITINSNNSISDILSEMIIRKSEQNEYIIKLNNKIDLKFKQLLKKNKSDSENNSELSTTILSKDYIKYNQDIQSYKIDYIKNNSTKKELEHFNSLILNFYKSYEEFTYVSEDYLQSINNISYQELSFNLIENFTSLNNKLNSDIQKLYYLLVAEKATNIQFPIYIGHYYDFRGRIYPNSALGFTYMKAIRSLYFILNNNTISNDVKSSIYFNKLINLNINLGDFDTEETINKYYLIIHFLELGKLNKNKFKDLNMGISLQEFVNVGISTFTTKNISNYKLEDYIYAQNLIKNIQQFLSYKTFSNITIIRDSTASFLQHWTIKLKLNNLYLDKLNLSGYIWYDTYSFIINTFLIHHPQYVSDLEFKHILNRKILKNMIMITNYNAGEDKCFTNLLLIIKEENINIEQNKLKSFSKIFWNFLRHQLFTILFLDSKKNYLQNLGSIIYCDDNSYINLTYLKNEVLKEDIKFKNQRWLINKTILTNEVDNRQTKTALNANIIQASDAELCRYLILKLNISTVHDSFAIDLFNTHKLMDETNNFFNKKLNLNNYAIFIII